MMCPNYRPKNWFECDMFSLSGSGYMVEHEIKLSASDFKADRKKASSVCLNPEAVWHERKHVNVPKHDRLHQGDEKGPSRFWYVMPKGLVEESEVPQFAGIIWAECENWLDDEGRDRKNARPHFEVVRPAPQLHRVKCRENILQHLGSIYYWRFWNKAGIQDCGGESDYDI